MPTPKTGGGRAGVERHDVCDTGDDTAAAPCESKGQDLVERSDSVAVAVQMQEIADDQERDDWRCQPPARRSANQA